MLTPIDLNSYLLVAIIAVGIKVITTFLKDVSWGKRRVAIVKRVKEISVKTSPVEMDSSKYFGSPAS